MRRNSKRPSVNLDIAPVNLIDLLLILLIFFITTTTFLQLKMIDLNIPVSSSKKVVYKKNITHIVNITKDCKYFIDKKAVQKEELAKELNSIYKSNKNSIFQVGADKESPHRCFVDILDIFSTEGIGNISVLTKNKE
ncbi:biopolymer transporter ExbD [Sulfurimonas lithotrophica]|uniref:Biopolymer transporter ExbD n=1 Tax=Sulfurimonas lithotrophica TaxID=2590022 RepID=A0A5P8P199_9BACT|nr:biopolymer transporter ExbD [Sulfurimonas lithotrophica]QFR49503.1 biopolymer transporter ExbD [Sulfurimonas lithotrophica]